MANGWTPERRARQSMLIRNWNPSSKSTRPKTIVGKIRSSQNAYKHGGRSGESIVAFHRIKELMRDQERLLDDIEY